MKKTENSRDTVDDKEYKLRFIEVIKSLRLQNNLESLHKYEDTYRQLNKDDNIPICFLDVNSNKPVDSDVFPQYQKKCKSSFSFSLIVYSDSLVNLLDLIENIEQAMKLSENIKGSLKTEYSGFEIASKEMGIKQHVALLGFSIEYIKEF